MRAADFVQHCLPGLQSQMIGIVQAQLASRLRKLVRSQALERCLRSDRHESGQWDGSMRETERACAGFGCLISCVQVVFFLSELSLL